MAKGVRLSLFGFISNPTERVELVEKERTNCWLYLHLQKARLYVGLIPKVGLPRDPQIPFRQATMRACLRKE